jgi:3-phenylpropionate/trans-cinnamate dioxygenase ferredoxin reductase subunit
MHIRSAGFPWPPCPTAWREPFPSCSGARTVTDGSGVDMAHFRYLIVGGGLAGDAAVEGIREVDAEGAVALIGAEVHAPYHRSQLTCGPWTGALSERAVFRTGGRGGVEWMPGRRAIALDTTERVVTDDRGERHGYERLLIATGCAARRLVGSAPEVVWLRTLDDARRLRGLAVEASCAVVIGGGFIGAEVAASLAAARLHVTLVTEGMGIAAAVLPAELSQAVTRDYRWHGLRVETGRRAVRVERRGSRLVVACDAGLEIEADLVVGAIGGVPETGLAAGAGLQVEDGIVVDDHLRTSVRDVYAAGDAARYPDALSGRSCRVEHEEVAVSMGRCAGRNMAGRETPYRQLPGFRLDLFGLSCEAVGEVDAGLESWADWRESHRKGAVFYGREGRVTGTLLCGLEGRGALARDLLERRELLRPETLRGRLTSM